jgi:uncharacterized protein
MFVKFRHRGTELNNCYVYVYIDPRNHEEFYFGKGKGTRKNAHLTDDSDSEKARRIKAIKKAGLEPIIRVIATDLSDHDALLVEKTLLWKLGKQLTNVASGHYSRNFRPHDTIHMEVSGFDYQRGLYYYNVGEGPHRNWDDYRKLGFISAGQGVRWRDGILGFQKGDVIAAYLKGHGYVGIGVIRSKAKPIRDVVIQGKPLLMYEISSRIAENSDSDELSEYVSQVRWVASDDRRNAKWERNASLYTTTHIRASLDGQPDTVKFLEREFKVDIKSLLI